MNFLIVGAGFSGAVLARQLVENLNCHVEVWDERNHIGGNCHTEREIETGVMVHKYGPHIFNTDNERVWKFLGEHGKFRTFINRVKASTARGVFSMPINLLTINQFFGKMMNPDEARQFVTSLGDHTIEVPQNFEEQALKMLGRDLYEIFFKGYTIKQWGCDPKNLPASVLKRLPIRFNYDDSYYSKKYQGIPAEGYTEVIRSILNHPCITVLLNKQFGGQRTEVMRPISDFQSPAVESPSDPPPATSHPPQADFDHVFYTGPLDAFFDYSEGRLGYRTVNFEQIQTEVDDYQGNAVINYPDMSVPWTRIHEHKHFAPWEKHQKTVAFREFSKETEAGDIPYYPKRLAADKAVLARYRALAEDRSLKSENRSRWTEADGQKPEAKSQPSDLALPVSFLGRLATYRYMDMEAVIGEALEFADKFVDSIRKNSPRPIFPNNEE